MAGLTASDLGEIESLLRSARRAIVDSVRGRLPSAATDDASKAEPVTEGAPESDAPLTEDEAALLGHAFDELRAIDDALRRIEFNVGGLCVQCGEPIALARLKAVPTAALCASCAGLTTAG